MHWSYIPFAWSHHILYCGRELWLISTNLLCKNNTKSVHLFRTLKEHCWSLQHLWTQVWDVLKYINVLKNIGRKLLTRWLFEPCFSVAERGCVDDGLLAVMGREQKAEESAGDGLVIDFLPFSWRFIYEQSNTEMAFIVEILESICFFCTDITMVADDLVIHIIDLECAGHSESKLCLILLCGWKQFDSFSDSVVLANSHSMFRQDLIWAMGIFLDNKMNFCTWRWTQMNYI